MIDRTAIDKAWRRAQLLEESLAELRYLPPGGQRGRTGYLLVSCRALALGILKDLEDTEESPA